MFNWLKKNWSILILLIIALFYLKNTYTGRSAKLSLPASSDSSMGIAVAPQAQYRSSSELAPSSSSDRLLITDTSLSLQVKDVSQTIKDIDQKTKDLGGFLVSSHLSKPELAASGNIIVRVPTDKLSIALESFKSIAIKVVSESVNGTDVTDQYEDLQSRLDILNKTKAKFETIMDRAVSVTDLLSVQRELVSLQSQIDAVIGSQDYLKKSADLSKITIYLATDQLSLPYAPTNVWRPIVTIKTAIRAFLVTLMAIANLVIWIAIYSPLMGLAYIVYRIILKKRKQKTD